jgi:hypothetical protein
MSLHDVRCGLVVQQTVCLLNDLFNKSRVCKHSSETLCFKNDDAKASFFCFGEGAPAIFCDFASPNEIVTAFLPPRAVCEKYLEEEECVKEF